MYLYLLCAYFAQASGWRRLEKRPATAATAAAAAAAPPPSPPRRDSPRVVPGFASEIMRDAGLASEAAAKRQRGLEGSDDMHDTQSAASCLLHPDTQ